MEIMKVDRMETFFREQFERVLSQEHLPLSDAACAHTINVLLWAAYQGEQVAHHLGEAIGPQFLEAMRTPQTTLLRKVGDQALLLRGVWWQYVERPHAHGVPAGYYEDIGQRAYLLIRTACFDELGNKFVPLTRVLALLWSYTPLCREDDICTLYSFWMRTRSAYARAILERHGIRVNLQRRPS